MSIRTGSHEENPFQKNVVKSFALKANKSIPKKDIIMKRKNSSWIINEKDEGNVKPLQKPVIPAKMKEGKYLKDMMAKKKAILE